MPGRPQDAICQPLTAALIVALGLGVSESALARAPMTWSVTDCTDAANASTLRGVIANANTLSGDTVDLSACANSTITLTQGAIPITQASLTLQGAALISSNQPVVTVAAYDDGAGAIDRVFYHKATSGPTGTLTLKSLDIEKGKYRGAAATGGCIYSDGNITMRYSRVSNCYAKEQNTGGLASLAKGGGVFATGNVSLYDSVVSDNKLRALDAHVAPGTGYVSVRGAGVLAKGTLKVSYSTISGNSAAGVLSFQGACGGTASYHATTFTNSTIDNNYAAGNAGGICVYAGSSTAVSILNSTISGNKVNDGGVFQAYNISGLTVFGVGTGNTLTVENSTIVFNGANTNGKIGMDSNIPTTLQSSIIALNTGTDLYVSSGGTIANSNADANNLITGSKLPSSVSLPPNTMTGDPLLAPLAFHGGAGPRTHALLAGSPAIGTGNNVANLPYDERGVGFLRPTIFADIGAYERQRPDDDEMFYDGFGPAPGW